MKPRKSRLEVNNRDRKPIRIPDSLLIVVLLSCPPIMPDEDALANPCPDRHNI